MDRVIVTIGLCGHWEGHDDNHEGWDGLKIHQDTCENKKGKSIDHNTLILSQYKLCDKSSNA